MSEPIFHVSDTYSQASDSKIKPPKVFERSKSSLKAIITNLRLQRFGSYKLKQTMEHKLKFLSRYSFHKQARIINLVCHISNFKLTEIDREVIKKTISSLSKLSSWFGCQLIPLCNLLCFDAAITSHGHIQGVISVTNIHSKLLRVYQIEEIEQ